jgi:gliding motility-associated-like protein
MRGSGWLLINVTSIYSSNKRIYIALIESKKIIMRCLSKIVLGLVLSCILHTAVQAQLLPPNQPEQDACNALQLCGNSFHTPYGYQGIGLVSDLTNTPCNVGGLQTGEDKSMWLKLVVVGAGDIVFTITPVQPLDDYDFAILNTTNVNCNNLSSSNVIRCNFNSNIAPGTNGIIGLNLTSTITSVPAGSVGNNFLQKITAAAGDEYLIMINNFGFTGGASSGFTIDFTGSTAIFQNTQTPHFDQLQTGTACSYRQGVTVHLNTPILCSSIAANGSDFQLSNGGIVSAAVGVNCSGAAGYTQDVTVTFSPALAPGTYTIKPKIGTDGNTLLNLCNLSTPLTDSLTFTVAPAPLLSQAQLVCTTLNVTTNVPIQCNTIAANGSDFVVAGPGPIAITNAVGVNCNAAGLSNSINLTLAAPISVSGAYTVTIQNGVDGNTLKDSCATDVVAGAVLNFNAVAKPILNLPDSLTTCNNTGILLPLVINNPDNNVQYNFTWTPASGLDNANIAQPFAQPTTNTTYTVNVASNNSTMCSTKDSIFITTLPQIEIITQDTGICEGNSFAVVVNGSDLYTYTWTPTAGVSNPNIKQPVLSPNVTTQYVLTAQFPGCNDNIDQLQVDVEPNNINIDFITDRQFMCRFDTILISATVSPQGLTYTYAWSPTGSLQYSNTPNNAFFGDTTTSVSLTVSTPLGCVSTDSILLTVFDNRTTYLNTYDTGLCVLGSPIQLQAGGSSSYVWTPSEGLSATDIANPLASPETTTTYFVYGTNTQGCKDTQSVTVHIYPAAIINIPDTVTVYPGTPYQLEPYTNASYFEWYPPSGLNNDHIANPLMQPEVRTRYFVTARTENGCVVNDSIDVRVEATEWDVPNAFAPNGTEGNMIFKPTVKGALNIKSFDIFNRWGQKVFESQSINKGWDGTKEGVVQPMGVYVYRIEAVTEKGISVTKTGNVTLLR